MSTTLIERARATADALNRNATSQLIDEAVTILRELADYAEATELPPPVINFGFANGGPGEDP